MADTDNIIEALKTGAKRVRMADGSETEFLLPEQQKQAMTILNEITATTTGRRRRVIQVTPKTGYGC